LTAIFCCDISNEDVRQPLKKKNKKPIFPFRTGKVGILSFVLISSLICLLNASKEKADPWEKWLAEVEPIMTKTELSVFESLKTEEDKRTFQKLFWEVRDPTPRTSQNEFRTEYYARRRYAENNLEGFDSDRGKIYVLLGKPIEKKNYVGYESLIDCELWIYKSEGRPGLPPFMYLIYYRPNNVGKYRLFYPGHNSAIDLLSRTYSRSRFSKTQAYNFLKESFPELASATLSVIPEVGIHALAGYSTSSATVLARIYTLPEREVEKNYLRRFTSAEGFVDVTYTTKEIAGKGSISISEDRGFKFINYALLPDIIRTTQGSGDLNSAKIFMNLRIEDSKGKTIHQQEREVNLDLDQVKQKAVAERKLVFKDFAPIIKGEFQVSLTFSNKETDEFFIHEEKINITDRTLPVVVGYKVKEVNSENFIPTRMGIYKVLADPRSIYNYDDSLEGLIYSESTPQILLRSEDEKNISLTIKDITRQGKLCIFRQPLRDLKPGNYVLNISSEGMEVYHKVITVLSFRIEKPIELETSEPYSSHFNYTFLLGQEYLNKGETETALEQFKKLPENLWNARTLPVIARAYYQKKDYEKVVELLEREIVSKDFPVLVLLGNSCLELKKFQKAAEYFEMLRKYGDTVENNRILAAIYYALGQRDKAQVYSERAKNLEKKLKEKSLDKKKEQGDENP